MKLSVILTVTTLLAFAMGRTTVKGTVLYDLSSVKLAGSVGANAFFMGAGTSDLAVDGISGPLTAATTTGGFTYFVFYFDAASLEKIGDSLTVSFQGTLTGGSTSNQAFRLGLFDSHGTKLSGNVDTPQSNVFNAYSGYRADYRIAGAPSPNSGNNFRRRLGQENSKNLFATSADTPILDGTQVLSLNLSPSNVVTGSFSLKRVSTGIEITSSISGNPPQTVSGGSTSFQQVFDSFAFALSGDTGKSAVFQMSTLNVTYSTIPEPATALFLGTGFLALALGRRVFR